MTAVPFDERVGQLLVHAVIHAHHDETIALFASGAVKELRVIYPSRDATRQAPGGERRA